jgi:hypothetical protein
VTGARAAFAAACTALVALVVIAAAGCATTPPAAAAPVGPVPTEEAILRSEESRAGSLGWVHARGVAELRWRDASGDHFEQGDLDLRWCAGRGIAASISKFGDRHAWIGSDGVRWWRFAPKARPSTLDVGVLQAVPGADRSVPDECAVTPALLGMAPLRPRAGARVAIDGVLAWVELDPAGLPSTEGGRFEAGFDATSLEPRAVRMVDATGAVAWRVAYDDVRSIEVPGAAPGSWPRAPRRIEATRGEGGASLLLALGSISIDREAVDRAPLYDLEALRARFAPESVRVLE